MKTKNLLSVVLLLTVSLSVFGQYEPKPVKRVSINDIFIQTGFFSMKANDVSYKDFEALNPNSILFTSDLTGFSPSGGFTMTGNAVFSVNMGIQFSDKQKTKYLTNPLLRLGISYFSGTTLTSSLYKEDRRPFDTLVSLQTGQLYYIDSVTTQNYNMEYSSDQLRFDGSVIFRTNPADRWSIYSGIGITAGISIHAETDINYSININTGDDYSSGSSDFITEKYKNKNNFGFSAYVPMGIDFRIGKKKEFWKRIHLYYEARPCINFTVIPELHTYTNAGIQHGFGIRVNWD